MTYTELIPRFRGTLLLAADTPQQLRASDVDRVMTDAGQYYNDFRMWLLDFPLQPRTKQVLYDWKPQE